jgi:fibronectin type 3 domain-containing protein
MKLSHHITLSAFKSLLIVAFLPLFLVACGGSDSSPSQGEKNISTLKIIDLTANSASQITLSWSGVAGVSYYEIYRNTSDTNTSLTAIATQITATSYVNTNLTPKTRYYYWVKSCNTNTSGKKCSDFSKVAFTTTLILPPDVPTTLTLSADSISQITVSWNGNGANSYKLYRNTNNSNAGLTAIATPTNTSYEDTGLMADTTYYYWVTACKKSPQGVQSCSDFSKVASKTTQIVPPNVPTDVSLTADSASQITLSWSGVAGVSYYEIYRNTSDTNTSLTAIATQITATSYVNTNLTPKTRYYYWVKSCNTNTSGKKCSDFSQFASTTTLSVPKDAPPRITNVSLSADSTSQITVSWTGNNEATSYQIYRNTINSITNLAAIATPTNTSYEDTGLTADTTYYYWVKACKRNSQGRDDCSDFSQVASKTTLVVIPSIPKGLSLTADSASQITVLWTGNGVRSYEIYRHTSDSNAGLTAIANPSTDAAYVNTNLTPNTTYYYWVKACNANTSGKRCSDFSQVASKATLVVIPNAPTDLAFNAESISQISVSWNGNGAHSYKIYRHTSDASAAAISVATTESDSYTDTGLNPGTLYYYWVKACSSNLEGIETCSDFSEVSSANTTLDSPKNLQLSGVTTSQITVSWDSVTGTNYYEVFRNTIDSNSSLTTAINQPANTTYTDSGLSTDTTYYYWVKGCSTGDICSDFSEVASTKTLKGEFRWTTATDSAAFSARYWHQSVVFDNKMWVIGGVKKNNVRKNDVWSSTNGITWTTATDSAAFSARYGHQSVVFDNKIWVISGSDGSPKNDVWRSTDGVIWTTATDSAAFSARQDYQAVVFNDGNSTKMWVIGGIGSGFKNDVFSSTDGVTWTTATASAQFPARDSHQSVVFNKKMWVIGGRNAGGNPLNDVWSSTDGVTWTKKTDSAAFSGRQDYQAVVFDNKIWVIGGNARMPGETGNKRLNDVWNSIDGVTWTKATDSAQFSIRDSHQSVVFDNKMWVIGGFVSSHNLKNDVWHTVKE